MSKNSLLLIDTINTTSDELKALFVDQHANKGGLHCKYKNNEISFRICKSGFRDDDTDDVIEFDIKDEVTLIEDKDGGRIQSIKTSTLLKDLNDGKLSLYTNEY